MSSSVREVSLDLIASDSFLTQLESWTEDDVEAYLAHRDTDAFDEAWMAAFQTLEAGPALTAEQTDEMDEVGQAAFAKTFARSRDGELAAYVSDDFELIIRHATTGASLDTPTRYLAAYERGDVPR